MDFIKKTNALSAIYSKLSDEELKQKSTELKQKVQNSKKKLEKTLNEVVAEAFALVKEASSRALKYTPYNTQFLAAYEIFKGNIVQMSQGEGKTLSIILAAYLKSLSGNHIHIMTETNFLLKRDFNLALQIFNYLDLSVGIIPSKKDAEYQLVNKLENYDRDIVYVYPIEAAFDYLKAVHVLPETQDSVLKQDYWEKADLIIDDIDKVIATKEPSSAVLLSPDKQDMDNILLVDYIKKYNTIGAAANSAIKETKFYKKYLNKKVVLIPENKKSLRIDLPDNISRTKDEKFDKILDKIREIHKYRVPIIVAIPDKQELEMFIQKIDKKGFIYNIVDGEEEARDALYLSQAGRLNKITVVTTLSGVDVPEGGDAFYLTRQELHETGLKPNSALWNSKWDDTYNYIKKITDQEKIEVDKLGGIFTIIADHTDNDQEFRAFSARGGVSGTTQFFVSLEDSFLNIIDMKKFFSIINSLKLNREKVMNNKFVSSFIVSCAKYIHEKNDRIVS